MNTVPSTQCASSDFIVKECHVHGLGIHLWQGYGDYHYRCRSCLFQHKIGDCWYDPVTKTNHIYDGTFWQPEFS